MAKMAWDVDGTLIMKNSRGQDVPRYDVIQMLHFFCLHDCYVWSGSGVDYAKKWCEKLGLTELVTVVAKGSIEVDIAFDDQDVELGKINIKV